MSAESPRVLPSVSLGVQCSLRASHPGFSWCPHRAVVQTPLCTIVSRSELAFGRWELQLPGWGLEAGEEQEHATERKGKDEAQFVYPH